ncbi:MAG: aldehyde dehydrogenase family protein [Candidatus Accumulibacter sp.]|jgi:aldehyde dehydrogenase (NAD+)|nr:aldehyde dehydrogenase family protein [Accumulibacter sp.]
MSTNPSTVHTHQNYIAGKWRDASDGSLDEHRNPARMSEVTGRFPRSTDEDVRAAVDAAEAAFPAWRDLTAHARADYLKRALALMIERTERVARVISIENGKTLAESRGEIVSAIKEMEYQIHQGLRDLGEIAPSAQPGVLAYQYRRPLGVCAVISPWNFPFNVPGRKCAPALIAGNTVVLKPASLTPNVGLEFTRLFADAGLPPGVLNCLTGSGSGAGESLLNDSRIQAISFTGSTQVGIHINQLAAGRLVRTQLELGGKNPMVVLEDADFDEAVLACATAAFACAGQWCTSTSRVIVAKKIAGAFVEAVLAKARALKLGSGLDPATTMGPVCGTQQMKNVLGFIEQGKKEGAKLLTGGCRATGEGLDDGCFIEPTVFVEVNPAMTIAQEEIFGPVLSVLRADGFDEAVAIANGVRFGLASSIYTKDFERAMRFVEKTEAGLTHVNMISAYKEPQFSFGGIKESGSGIPEGGRTGIEFFTEHKTAYLKYRP